MRYFPEFSSMIDELSAAAHKYRLEIYRVGMARHLAKADDVSSVPSEDKIFDGAIEAMKKASKPYVEVSDRLITALQDFARKAFQ
jgi:hypothetical protein